MLKSSFIFFSLLFSMFLFSQEKDTTFTLCNKGTLLPYYNPELTYKGGFWEVKQHYQKEYPASQFQALKNNSGIITIQFKVNCKGKTGNFVVQQCDLDYQAITLDKKITAYLLMKTKTLTNWIPAKDEEGQLVNCHKFFSFRMKSGQLLEILPK